MLQHYCETKCAWLCLNWPHAVKEIVVIITRGINKLYKVIHLMLTNGTR